MVDVSVNTELNAFLLTVHLLLKWVQDKANNKKIKNKKNCYAINHMMKVDYRGFFCSCEETN